MAYDALKVETAGGVTTVCLHRPEQLNALTTAMGWELTAAMRTVAADTKARAVVLTGTGRAFSAGGDFEAIRESNRDALKADAGVRSFLEAVRAIRELDVPVVAKLNGDAIGGSAGLAFACDFRLAVDSARLGIMFQRIGLAAADAGMTYLLPRLVGLTKATELLLLGDLIPAPEAERLGLINKAVPAEQLDAEVDTLVARLVAAPPLAMRLTKRALRKSLDTDMQTELDFEGYVQSLCMQTADVREGVAAFLEKRTPQFLGY